MLIRRLTVLSLALVVLVSSLVGCQGPDAKPTPKPDSKTTAGKK